MKALGRLAMAAALIVPLGAVGLSATSSGAATQPTAICKAATGTATYTPGLRQTLKQGQHVFATEATAANGCTGGTVTSASITTLGNSRNSSGGLVSVPVSCNSLLANMKNSDLPFAGTINVKWNAGMGHTQMKISAHVTASTGTKTTFTFRGTTNDSAQSPFAAGRSVHGVFTVGSGLNTVASGGSCQATVNLKGGAISGGTLNVA